MPRSLDGFVTRTPTRRATRVQAHSTVQRRLRRAPTPLARPTVTPHAAKIQARQIAKPIPSTPVAVLPKPAIPETESPQSTSSFTRRSYSPPALKPTRRRGIPERLQLPLIIIAAMVAGIFAQSAVLGEILIAGYGAAALIWRIASRTTFTLALLSCIATTLVLIIRGNILMAQNFATYTFLLLVVGVITLIRELNKEGGRIYSSRKNIS